MKSPRQTLVCCKARCTHAIQSQAEKAALGNGNNCDLLLWPFNCFTLSLSYFLLCCSFPFYCPHLLSYTVLSIIFCLSILDSVFLTLFNSSSHLSRFLTPSFLCQPPSAPSWISLLHLLPHVFTERHHTLPSGLSWSVFTLQWCLSQRWQICDYCASPS